VDRAFKEDQRKGAKIAKKRIHSKGDRETGGDEGIKSKQSVLILSPLYFFFAPLHLCAFGLNSSLPCLELS
jgi:hypothetical protein